VPDRSEETAVRNRNDEARPRPDRAGLGLSWKVLLLTVLFVMVSELLIYIPSISSFRKAWLHDRVTMADAASLVLASSGPSEVPRDIQDELLKSVGANAIALRTGDVSRLIAADEMPPEVDQIADLRTMRPLGDVVDALKTLASPREQVLRIIGTTLSGSSIEVVMGDRALQRAMLQYSINIISVAALISVITAILLYIALNRLLVRPMRRMTANMVAFAAAPEDATRVIEPSHRRDEIGVAEMHLAAMQRDLQATLAEQRHLADLGLAVSKINHDLRNMLAAAQLFSDRLGSLPDPNVQRFAPKLIAALDRAIAFCQTTLAYGRAREAPPARRLVALNRLVDEVAETVGLAGHATVAWDNAVPPGLEIDADPDQLFRVLVNLCRNALQALEADSDAAIVRRVTINARRDNGVVTIRVADTGPGVPDAFRGTLFQAFQGSSRPGGAGLGLAIAAELLRAHGGSIALVDRPGPGAVFDLVVPDRPARSGRSNGG
jgi:signal transduction histidine kinase